MPELQLPKVTPAQEYLFEQFTSMALIISTGTSRGQAKLKLLKFTRTCVTDVKAKRAELSSAERKHVLRHLDNILSAKDPVKHVNEVYEYWKQISTRSSMPSDVDQIPTRDVYVWDDGSWVFASDYEGVLDGFTTYQVYAKASAEDVDSVLKDMLQKTTL